MGYVAGGVAEGGTFPSNLEHHDFGLLPRQFVIIGRRGIPVPVGGAAPLHWHHSDCNGALCGGGGAGRSEPVKRQQAHAHADPTVLGHMACGGQRLIEPPCRQ